MFFFFSWSNISLTCARKHFGQQKAVRFYKYAGVPYVGPLTSKTNTQKTKHNPPLLFFCIKSSAPASLLYMGSANFYKYAYYSKYLNVVFCIMLYKICGSSSGSDELYHSANEGKYAKTILSREATCFWFKWHVLHMSTAQFWHNTLQTETSTEGKILLSDYFCCSAIWLMSEALE